MNEKQPPQPRDEPDPTMPRRSDEQAGDIYEVDIAEDVSIRRAAKLPHDGDSDEAPRHEEDTIAESPRIWVGSWSDYNNGILHGRWINAAQDVDSLWTDITAMLGQSPTSKRYGEP